MDKEPKEDGVNPEVSPEVSPAVSSAAGQGAMAEEAPRAPFWIDVLGWYGTAAIVGAYAALSFGWLPEGALYHGLNLTGALGVGLVCWRRRTWQPFWLEVVWAAVAAIALVRLAMAVG